MLVYDQYIYPEKPVSDDDIIVFHSGFCSTSANYSYGKDTRDYYLIHYVIRGKGIYSTEKSRYALSQHDGFLITPGSTIVHTADAADPWDVVFIAFYGRKAAYLLKLAGLDEDHLIFHYEDDDFLEKCIKDIYNESRFEKNIVKITGYFYFFIAKLIDIYEIKRNLSSQTATFSHFDDAIIYIRRNIHSKITVESLANYLRLNTSQVYRIFKKETNQSPQQLINEMRIEKTCELLEKTDLSVTEIAEWMDFEYVSHFSKCFKAKTNMTPSEYRNSKK